MNKRLISQTEQTIQAMELATSFGVCLIIVAIFLLALVLEVIR